VRLAFLLFAIGTLANNSDDSTLSFDAASLKPVEVPDNTPGVAPGRLALRRVFYELQKHEGGPGTMDPTRIHYVRPLQSLIAEAFEVHLEQTHGPDWMLEMLIDIDAVVPPDTTVHDGRLMLRNLLIDRFHMEYHTGLTPVNGYALVIDKRSPALSLAQSAGKPGIHMTVDNRGWTVTFERQTMREFATYLARQYNSPVEELTGLSGEYSFTLQFFPPGWGMPDPELHIKYFPRLSSVIHSKLKLKLKNKKLPGPFVAIDRLAQTPIGN